MLHDFLNLIFPNQCRACEKNLMRGEKLICTFCNYMLPKTNYHLFDENPVFKRFWGKVNITHATAYYFFHKGEKVQHLVHALKYKGEKEVGIKLGEWYANDLKTVPHYAQSDYIIPVPLHKARQHSRGYNQSEVFGIGLANGLGKVVLNDFLIRSKATETQTRKKRYSRYENMKDVFSINHSNKFNNKTFLLVDDVITTGSTLAACAEEILKIPGATVNIAAIAYATK